MTGRRANKWGAASGLILCLLWAPMGYIMPKLPDLGSAAGIERFYHDQFGTLKWVLLSVSAGFFFLLCFLGTVMARLRRAEESGPLTWIALAGALMFMTSLNIAVGLTAAAGLLSKTSTPDITAGLHSAAFVLAAPAAPAGTAFFGATAVVSLTRRAFPRWAGWAAVIAAVANIGATSGIFSLTGPLNSGNGTIGGITAPILTWVAWILLASLWLASEGARPRSIPSGPPT
jgi:hypothetical protein